MASDIFERRREAIRQVREAHARVSYRQRLQALKRGDFDDEEEALEGIERGPFVVSDDDVLESFAQTLDTVKVVRAHADELERNARAALRLEVA